jgi:hypothetical protein
VIGTITPTDTYSPEAHSEFALDHADQAACAPKRLDISERGERVSKLQIRALVGIEPSRCDMVLAVSRCLKSSRNFELRRVVCHVERGELILCGQVSSYFLKQLAQEAVRSLAADNRIINRLLVVEVPKYRDEVTEQEGFKS